jgi:hypothetical protein
MTNALDAVRSVLWQKPTSYQILSDKLLEADQTGNGYLEANYFAEILEQVGLKLSQRQLEDVVNYLPSVESASSPSSPSQILIEYKEFLQFMANSRKNADSAQATDAPDLIKKLLWHSRQMDVDVTNAPILRPASRAARSRPASAMPMSHTYRHFNNSVFSATTQDTRSLVDVTTFYDADRYTRRGRHEATMSTSRPGSLAVIFDFYARITSAKKKLNHRCPTFEEIQRAAGGTVTLPEMACFLRDFLVMPRYGEQISC